MSDQGDVPYHSQGRGDIAEFGKDCGGREMNIYRNMTEHQANIVKGLCMCGTFDLAKEFIDFIIEKQDSGDQTSDVTGDKK